MDTITTILVVVTCSILGLGVAVVSNSRNKLNQVYFANIVTIIGWLLTMIFYRLAPDSRIVLWTKLLYVSATLIASNFLYFTYIFPDKINSTVSLLKKVFIFLPNLIIVCLILFGDLIIKDANTTVNGENVIHFGKVYILYAIYILFYFDYSFVRLYKKFKASINLTEKMQINYLFIGYVSSGLIAFTTNLILPWLGYYELNWLGQVSTLLMAVSATYAIVKHHLFSAKIIATELITFAIWIILLVRLLTSETFSERMVNGITFVMIFFAGLSLIRSVIKEVLLREHIQILADDLEKANKNQVTLIHFITHQVKGFFTKSRDIFSILLENEAGNLPSSALRFIKEGFESDTRGVAMVEDVLNASNIKSGTVTYTMKPFDLRELVGSFAVEYRSIAEKKGLTLTYTDSEAMYMINGDRTQLSQVFKNIIDNAIKYTPSGTVAVTLSRVGDKVVFTVKDSGVGLSEDDRKLLFTQGGRGNKSTRINVDSTGYGLFIAKNIIDAHGGRIWAESRGEGKGTTFAVELPSAPTAGKVML